MLLIFSKSFYDLKGSYNIKVKLQQLFTII